MPANVTKKMIEAAEKLRTDVGRLRFSPPVVYVYNPLEYAWAMHQRYLRTYALNRKKAVFVGMNPGPFGMVQTGVPFGEIAAVRDWMKLEGPVGKPKREHPKRPVEGFACPKSEVSGRRLWGLFARRYPVATDFFKDFFVANYCPLAFMEESGRNLTPDKLPREESDLLLAACDRHLGEVLQILAPEWVIGIGQFAAKRVEGIPGIGPVKIISIPHPSPANPAANRNWAERAEKVLVEAGIWAS